MSASEFGRTLTSNGQGTDHGWGGNHFVSFHRVTFCLELVQIRTHFLSSPHSMSVPQILGGSVKGGRIHGQYPDDLTSNNNKNIGRGRFIPTTPWEG